MKTERPNILYLHSHDTGRWIQPYGAAISTPNLAAFAQQALVFDNAFACAPSCSPSRAALLTGQMPAQAGMVANVGARGGRLNDYKKHLVHVLSAIGYTTALAGVQHEAPDPQMIGYDHLLGGGDEGLDRAVAFLSQPRDRPFFLSVGFHETHRRGRYFTEQHTEPFPGPTPAPRALPDSPDVRADLADFARCAHRLDRKMGRVLDALRDAGLEENTLVICTTDHGPSLPGHKLTLTGRGLGVFLMLRGPGGFDRHAPAAARRALVSQLDLLPTLCDLLKIAPPPWLQGESLMPLVRGQTRSVREAAFGQINYHAAYEPTRSVRTDRLSYIRRFHAHPKPVLANIDDSPSKDALLASGWADLPQPSEALYDLTADPDELRDVAGEPVYAQALAEMRARLDQHMVEACDPLLAGPIPMPIGGRFNRASDASPHDQPTLGG